MTRPNRQKLTFTSLFAASLFTTAFAFDTFAFQGMYAQNGSGFVSVAGSSGNTNASTALEATQSYSGKDSQGNDQTMVVWGRAYSSSTFGQLKVFGEGRITNPYYNASNPVFWDGANINPEGSPDAVAMNGNAGFNDELTYSGLGSGQYKVNFYFYLHGQVTGEVESGLNFYTNDPSGEFYAPRTTGGNSLWITPWYNVSSSSPLSITADFYGGMNTKLFNVDEGGVRYSKGDYSNTVTLVGMTIKDENDNLVEGWSVNAASGTQYATGAAVPEPMTVLALGAGLAALARRRKNQH